MSTSAANSPIQSLSFDVLWRIFDINADIFSDDTALITTLATSYVCRDWRSFLLSSTSIWAHVMDLDHSLWSKVEGSREMIRRSGTAFIWMKVYSLSIYRRDGKQILDIINANWDRIQKLEAIIYDNFVDRWTPLYRPAPCLQSLSISFYYRRDKSSNILPSLFSGSAPMLRNFYWEGQRLKVTAMAWLCQVRSMELSTQLTVSETLVVLASTMNLTSLQLDYYIAADGSAFAHSPVSLPKLARLELILSHKLSPGATLLEHMFIPPSCAVRFSVKQIQRNEIDKKSKFGPIIKAISTCAQRCFSDHPPLQLHIVITPSSFTFEATHHSDTPKFIFHLNLVSWSRGSHTFPRHALTMLLRGFSLPGLSKVTFLKFRITAVLQPLPALSTFIACLPSVNTISTEKLSLRHLRAYTLPKGGDTAVRIVFPVLKTLRLFPFTPPHYERSRFDSVRDPVTKYVRARISRGQAISVIEFTEVNMNAVSSIASLRKARYLGKANFLKVIWRQRGGLEMQEYICGTSAPQERVGGSLVNG